MEILHKDTLIDILPPLRSSDQENASGISLAGGDRIIVVLDDDPTGTQTVNGISVLTEWSTKALEKEFSKQQPAFYILTNTRSMSLSEAERINREIGVNIQKVEKHTGKQSVLISRSDSTLRGHFPGEINALIGSIGKKMDGCLLVPFFEEGGRYTLNDVHYVQEGNELIPVGQTPFAEDVIFGYKSSNLRKWVEEKTGGLVKAQNVLSISLADIRTGGVDAVVEKLTQLHSGAFCIVNAVEYEDLNLVVKGIDLSLQQGKNFLFRTAASFVPIAAGIQRRPILDSRDLKFGNGCGLIVVGSHVPKTTRQIHFLGKRTDIPFLELNVTCLQDAREKKQEISRISHSINQAAAHSLAVVLYSRREFLAGETDHENLQIGRNISSSLVSIVKRISFHPRYILSKGGITSSDIATKALHVKKAEVLGQVAPGVPLWRLGEESTYPGLNYIVFPGNVGSDETLYDVVRKFYSKESL